MTRDDIIRIADEQRWKTATTILVIGTIDELKARVKRLEDALRKLSDENMKLRVDAERYRYLRNRDAAYVLKTTGPAAECWIDCDGEDGGLCLLTGGDADAAIDAARGEK
jgi:hypothetical protein